MWLKKYILFTKYIRIRHYSDSTILGIYIAVNDHGEPVNITRIEFYVSILFRGIRISIGG
jgi:hypothetical protein